MPGASKAIHLLTTAALVLGLATQGSCVTYYAISGSGANSTEAAIATGVEATVGALGGTLMLYCDDSESGCPSGAGRDGGDEVVASYAWGFGTVIALDLVLAASLYVVRAVSESDDD